MTDKATELMPCPFCGGAAEKFMCKEPDNKGGHVIGCNNCKASTRVFYGECDAVLNEAWNTRTPPAAPVAEDAVEALADAMRFYSHDTAERCLRQLATAGYHLRRETMTEAELEREAKQVAMTVSALGFDRFGLIIELAKKFRG